MADPSGAPDNRTAAAPTRRARLLQLADAERIPLRTIVVTIALVVLVYLSGQLLYRLRDIVLLFVVAGFVALLLNPLVVALQRWKIRRRGYAVLIVTLWSVVIFVGLAFAFGVPLVSALTHFAQALPQYVQKAEHGKGWIGHVVRKYHIENWVQKNSPKLMSFAEGLGKPALALGKGAASVLAALAATFALVILLLMEAPRIRVSLLRMMSPARATRYSRIGSKVSKAVSGYMLGDILTSLIAGIVVFVTLTVLSVPYPLLFGLWVALVDFLPTIGGALAGIPTVLFAFGHSLSAGIVTAVVFLVYTQTENHLLNPVVMSKTVRVNPLLVFIAVLVGADVGAWLGGIFSAFVGILVAVPIAAAIQVVVQEVWNLTEPGPGSSAAELPSRDPEIPVGVTETSVSRPPSGVEGADR